MPESVEILFVEKSICPATNLVVAAFAPPSDTLDCKYLPIAFCVGTILLALAIKVGSFENSLITTCVPPTTIPPNESSFNPVKLNCEACRNKIKTINPEESITVTDEYQCVEFNLASGNTSNINIYNGRTTLGFKVLNDGNNLVWDNDDANSSYF